MRENVPPSQLPPPQRGGGLPSTPGPVAGEPAPGHPVVRGAIQRGPSPTDESDEVAAIVADVARCLHLSDDEANRLARLSRRSQEALAVSTVRALRTDVRRWVAWCAEARRLPLPARPQDVAQFVDDRTSLWRPSTLRRVMAAIARIHRIVGVNDPTQDEEVRLALVKAVKTCGKEGRGRPRQATGMTAPVVDACLAPLGTRLIDLRDTALVLVARDLLARRSELAAFEVSDVTPIMPDGGGRPRDATVLFRWSKTDQEGKGATGYLSPPTYAALRAWLDTAGITEGRLFRSVHVTGRVGTGLHPQKITEIFRKLATRAAPAIRALAVDPAGISGHSARVGMAQDLVAAGFELPAVMQAGRWKTSAMVARYSERLNAQQGAVAQFHAYGGPQPAHSRGVGRRRRNP